MVYRRDEIGAKLTEKCRNRFAGVLRSEAKDFVQLRGRRQFLSICERDTDEKLLQKLGKDEIKGLEANIRGEEWKWMTLWKGWIGVFP